MPINNETNKRKNFSSNAQEILPAYFFRLTVSLKGGFTNDLYFDLNNSIKQICDCFQNPTKMTLIIPIIPYKKNRTFL